MVSIGLDNNTSGKFVVYSKDECPYCEKAKELLADRNIPFVVYKYGLHFTKETLLSKVKLGINERLTVPQIFLNNVRIGGYDDLCNYLENGAYGDGSFI